VWSKNGLAKEIIFFFWQRTLAHLAQARAEALRLGTHGLSKETNAEKIFPIDLRRPGGPGKDVAKLRRLSTL